MSEESTLSEGEYGREYPYRPRTEGEIEFPKTADIEFRVIQPLGRIGWLGLVLAVCFAACDFAVLPLMRVFSPNDWGAVWVFAAGGAILAQAGLLTVGLVFVRGEFWRRFVVCWATAICLWTIWACGFLVRTNLGRQTTGDVIFTEMRFGALALPLAALSIQAPLWFLRLYRGWELIEAERHDLISRPLSIRDYMIGTGIVALSITAARLAVKPSQLGDDYWAVWSIFCASAAGISLISVAPAMRLMFGCRDWRLGWGMLVLYGAVGPAVVLALILICMPVLQSGFVGPNLWECLGLVIVFASFGGFLGAGLKAMRDRGYSLVVGRIRKA